ncbi:MAG TPA: hypothetical protein VNM24_11985 [Burkholderiales bacterium]|nr:hypothetical protein [Burkholderiales bacterium]
MRAAFLLAALVLPHAQAQEQAIQRELMLRAQQSDAFSLQLRQSLEQARIAPGDLERRRAVALRHLAERQRLGNASERQRLEVKADLPEALRPFERLHADEERRAIVRPVAESNPQSP